MRVKHGGRSTVQAEPPVQGADLEHIWQRYSQAVISLCLIGDPVSTGSENAPLSQSQIWAAGLCSGLQAKPAFQPPPISSVKEQRHNTLCPVRALHVSRTAGFRKADQLFKSLATYYTGKPLFHQRLSGPLDCGGHICSVKASQLPRG